MLLALDARTIFRQVRRGTGKNLIDLYRHLALARPDWRVVAFRREGRVTANPLASANVEPRIIEILGDRFDAWERLRLPMAAWRSGADLLHCPANTCPGWMPIPTVVTIHDLIPLDMPEGRPAAQVRRFAQSVHQACDSAAVIVCPSFYTRRRLIDEFGADDARVTVNPWAADSSVTLLPAAQAQPVARRYGVEGPMVLHFGAGEPRKNTAGVLEAWSRLPAPTRAHWTLLVVGLDDDAKERMSDLAAQRAIAQSVRLHGFAAEDDLPALLSAAEVLAFPSLSEGYGLPILDAWTTQTAVLTSDRTSLPEVAGDAALLVNPVDHDAIAAGLHRLIEDAALRTSLINRGTRRLAVYTWQRTAQRFARALEFAKGISNHAMAA